MEYFKGLSRKDYIVKANEMIKKDGIDSVSIRKLAKEMKCSSANLYRYFANRDELIYYAQLAELKDYITSLNTAEKVWKNVWERYVGVWYCYCMEAFRKPIAYNLIFFNNYETALSEAIGEDAGTLEEVYEPYLLMNGLINRTPGGRVATENAYIHLGIEMKG